VTSGYDTDYDYGMSLWKYGDFLSAMGRPDEAREQFNLAHEALKDAKGSQYNEHLWALYLHMELELKQGQEAAARELAAALLEGSVKTSPNSQTTYLKAGINRARELLK
jgi:hypothetical protein